MTAVTDPAKTGIAVASSFARTSPLRVATFGDSTANVSGGIAQHDLTAYNPAFPAAGNTTSVGVTADKWSLPILYPQAYLVANGGISGESTTQMLARDAAASSATRKATADVINLRPDVVFLRGASINDLTTVTSATLAATVSAVFSRHCQIISRLLAGGAVVIDEGCYGFSGVATDANATRSALLQLNAQFSAYAAQYPGRLYFLNPVGLTCDGTGAFLPNMSTDGTHLTIGGAYAIAAAEASLLAAIFGRAVGPRFRGVNCVANAMFANTGAQPYGTVATGLSITAANATRQNAKVEVIDGVSWQTCEFVPTAASPSASIALPYDPSAASTVSPMGIVANDVFGFEFDFFVQDLNGGAPPLAAGMLGRVDTTKTAAGRVVWDALSPSYVATLASPYKGKCVIGPLMFTEPSANLSNTSGWIFNFQSADAVTPFKLGVSQPRIVKLGGNVTLM